MHENEKSKWSHSVVSDSSRPHGLQPTRMFRPWDFPGKSTGVGCHCLLQTKHCQTRALIRDIYSTTCEGVVSHFNHVQLFVTPWTVARQASLFMGFSRQEYWSGFLCPPPEDLPNLGIELWSPTLQANSLTPEPSGTPNDSSYVSIKITLTQPSKIL